MGRGAICWRCTRAIEVCTLMGLRGGHAICEITILASLRGARFRNAKF